jgi:hypothetical protein
MSRNTESLKPIGLFVAVLGLAACGGGGGGGGGGTPPGPPSPVVRTVSIGNDRILDEGSGGGTTAVEFAVTLDAAATGAVSVDYTITDVSTENPDFAGARTGTLVIPAGATTATITIDVVADDAFELDESFNVTLSNPSANAVIGDREATALLVNDDELRIVMDLIDLGYHDATVRFPAVKFRGVLEFDMADLLRSLGLDRITLPYDIYYTDEKHLPLIVAGGTLTFDLSDVDVDGRLLFSFVLDLPAGLDAFAIGGQFLIDVDWSAVLPTSIVRIIAPIEAGDVDPALPTLQVGNFDVFHEGAAGETTTITLDVRLSEALTTDLTLDYETFDSTATAPQDYVPASGSVTMAAGDTAASFTLTVNGDDDAEGVELIRVALSSTTNAAILKLPYAIVFIHDDDTPTTTRQVILHNAEILEGDSGTTTLLFDATLDAPAIQAITIRYATVDDTAEAGTDYEATDSEATFLPGESALTLAVRVFGDTDPEDDEQFLLQVTSLLGNATAGHAARGTIQTDDPIARVGIGDLGVAEGDSGTTVFAFAVTLDVALDEPLSLDFATSDVTTDSLDYTPVTSSLTIPAGATAGTVEVFVTGDTAPEDDEVFDVTLSTASASAILTKPTAHGTILNDDGAGGWSGAEIVHRADTLSITGKAVRAQVAFAPGGVKHAVYLQGTAIRHRASPAPGLWDAEETLGTVDSLNYWPRVVFDANGQGLAVWRDGFINANSYHPITGWQPAPLPMAIDVQQEIEVAGDPGTGETVIAWIEPANASNNDRPSIWAARFAPGSGWQNMGLVETTDDYAFGPKVAFAGGEAMIVYAAQPAVGMTNVVAYRLVGDTWVGPTVVDGHDQSHAGNPSIDMNAKGDVVVAWHQDEPVPAPGLPRRSIYANLYDAATDQWSGAALVERDLTHTAEDPEAAIDADGNAFVVWKQQSQDYATWSLYGSRYAAATTTWADPVLLELDDTATSLPIVSQQVAADDLGNAIVVWIQNDGVQQSVRSTRYVAADGVWTPAELLEEIDTGDANLPTLFVERATGNAMAIWHHAEAFATNIWANRYVN